MQLTHSGVCISSNTVTTNATFATTHYLENTPNPYTHDD